MLILAVSPMLVVRLREERDALIEENDELIAELAALVGSGRDVMARIRHMDDEAQVCHGFMHGVMSCVCVCVPSKS